VALPLYGALITFSRFGKRFESGLYRVGGTALYVNRGIGMEGGGAPRVRFWARPEITLIELVPAGAPR
jgi:predicted MPP superfamily phosphohydrolase